MYKTAVYTQVNSGIIYQNSKKTSEKWFCSAAH